MATPATDARDRITIERYVEGPEHVGHGWQASHVNLHAHADNQGDGRYRFRLRFLSEFRTRAHLEPATRILFDGEYYDVTDCVEVVRRALTDLFAERRIIEDIDHLKTGTRRTKAWP